jgi:hypothetical protein
MNAPIQPPIPPVNPVISIQPVVAAVSNQASGGAPSPLTAVPPGTLVEGFVINRDAQNNPILRTSIGDVRVVSDVFLKTGSEVVFRVDARQASLARIITVDGVTPEEYSVQNLVRPLARDTIAASSLPVTPGTPAASSARSGLPLAGGAPILDAIILQLQPVASPTGARAAPNADTNAPLMLQLAQLRSGAQIRLALLDLKLPPLPVALASVPSSPLLNDLLPEKPVTPQASPSPPPTAPTTGAPINATLIATKSPTSTPTSVLTPNPAPTPTAASILAQPPSLASPTAHSDTAPANPTPAAPLTQAIGKPGTAPTVTSAGALPTTATAAAAPAPALPSEVTTLLATLDHQQQVAVLKSQAATQEASVLRALYRTSPASPNAAATPSSPEQTPAALASPRATPPASSRPGTTQGPILSAQVIGHDAEGANILHTPLASLKLYTPQPLPTGTTLVVQWQGSAPNASANTATATSLTHPSTTTPTGTVPDITFDAVSEAYHSLLQSLPPSEIRAMPIAQPLQPNQLASALLFLMTAIKGGDVTALFGKRARIQLEEAVPELLARVRQELTSAQLAHSDSTKLPWIHYTLPMPLGQEIQPIRIYIANDGGEQKTSTAAESEGQRFVVELQLSALGPMQLDGFVRKSERRRSFDLMIRTVQPLDDDVCHEIRSRFTSSMEAVGMHGQILFQVGSAHFVKPALATGRDDNPHGMQTILA